MDIKGSRGVSERLVGILAAVDEWRHRLRHRLIMFAAYGPGYGSPDPDGSRSHMGRWTADPVVPLDSAKPGERPGSDDSGHRAA